MLVSAASRQKRVSLAIGLLLLSSGFAAGCSPVGKEATESNLSDQALAAAFRSSATKICDTYVRRIEGIDGLRSSAPAVLVAALTDAGSASIEETIELQKLRPPAGLRRDFAHLLSAENLRDSFLSLLIGRAGDVGRRALDEARSTWQRNLRTYSRVAAKLDLPACARGQLTFLP